MILEKYTVASKDVRVDVEIIGEHDKAFIYKVYLYEFEPATKALLEQVKNKLIVETRVAPEVMMSQDKLELLKKNLTERADELLKKEIKGMSESAKSYLIIRIIREMLGLGKLDILLADDNLEDIVVVSSTEPARVYHKKYGWLETNMYLDNEEEIRNYANIIGRRVGREINILKPLLDAHLPTGDRVNATLAPVSLKGNSITIRKFAREPWTVVDLISNKTCTVDIFALLWLQKVVFLVYLFLYPLYLLDFFIQGKGSLRNISRFSSLVTSFSLCHFSLPSLPSLYLPLPGCFLLG